MLNSLRFLGMSDFREIYRMTLYEYSMRMMAYRLRQVDKDFDIHLLAWESWNVQAMKKSGKKRVPVFRTFKKFFDYEKRVREVYENKAEVTETQKRLRGIGQILDRRKKEGIKQ